MAHHEMASGDRGGAEAGVVRRLIFLRVEGDGDSATPAGLFAIGARRIPVFVADVDVHNVILESVRDLPADSLGSRSDPPCSKTAAPPAAVSGLTAAGGAAFRNTALRTAGRREGACPRRTPRSTRRSPSRNPRRKSADRTRTRRGGRGGSSRADGRGTPPACALSTEDRDLERHEVGGTESGSSVARES